MRETINRNRLAAEHSPYLLQHAGNPVDWYPWGEEAFARARREDRPLFLSVGYATCHWCHVMERESFEDPQTARLLNELFVNVKVDREERPDIDRVYMAFLQATTGSGGWPLSAWLTPELKPFYAGTYFPRDEDARPDRPGFATVVRQIGSAWAERRDDLRRAAQYTVHALQEAIASSIAPSPELVDVPAVLQAGYDALAASYDPAAGGFGGPPKFPRPAVFDFLLRHHQRTGDDHALRMVVDTLRAMARGGIRDHLGGGFHRYAVDGAWHLPHFEKMLYDQAQLATSYVEAYQVTGQQDLARVARDIFGYVLRDLTDPQTGGFYSAEDADSPDGAGEQREGAHYVWRADRIVELLSGDAELFACHYGVTEEGNADDPHGELRGTNVLHQQASIEQTAGRFGRGVPQVAAALARARQILLADRATRPRPLLDDKIITAWNGLMISALARGAAVLGEPAYLAAARRAAGLLIEQLYDAELRLLRRRYRHGHVAHQGHLEDHAALAGALIDLYQVGGELRWLVQAEALTDRAVELFADEHSGGFYATSGRDPSVLLRIKDDHDGAEPSGNAMMAANLLRLARLVGRPELQQLAARTLRSFAHHLQLVPHAMPKMLVALQRWHEPAPAVVVVGSPESAGSLLEPLLERSVADPTVIWADEAFRTRYGCRAGLAHVFAMLDRWQDTPAISLCHDGRCEQPVTEPDHLRRLLVAQPFARHLRSSNVAPGRQP